MNTHMIRRAGAAVIAALLSVGMLACTAPAFASAWVEADKIPARHTLVARGTGVTTNVTETVDQASVYTSSLRRVIYWRQDALNDPNVKINNRTVPQYLSDNGISEAEYLSPKWSNGLERIALQRAVEAYDSADNHTRPNGDSAFTAVTSNNVHANAEILAYGQANIVDAIDGWASEKASYVSGMGGPTGHYETLINPGYGAYGFAMSSALNWGKVYAGEAAPASEDDAPTNLSGTYQFQVNLSQDRINRGVSSTLSSTRLAVGEKATVAFRVAYLQPRYTLEGWWATSDSNIVFVSPDGTAEALAKGEATLTLTASDSSAYDVTVTVVDDKPVYRVYDQNGTKKHLFTTSIDEYNRLVAKGWRGEGVKFYTANVNSSSPDVKAGKYRIVYRLYDKPGNRHFYTTDDAEHDRLVASGWRDETRDDLTWYSTVNGGVPVYRTYRASTQSHLFTLDKAEADKSVSKNDFRWDKGHEIAFYAEAGA